MAQTYIIDTNKPFCAKCSLARVNRPGQVCEHCHKAKPRRAPLGTPPRHP